MITLIVNGKKIQCPTRWADCSLRVFQRIIKEWEPDLPLEHRSRVLLFSILTGTSYEFVMATRDYGPDSIIQVVTAFAYEEGLPEGPIPDIYQIGERFVEISKDMGAMTIGQNIQARQAMGTTKDARAAMSLVTAIYIQRHYDSRLVNDHLIPAEFSLKRAKEIEPLILDLPITQIYPVGFFLLSRLANSGMTFLLNYLPRQLKRMQSRLLLPSLRRSINFPVIMNFQ